jgi:mannitol-1-phosphate/altronate dehydrogenase
MEGKKIIVFGAGKIGRSFIGLVFSLAGYEVVFVEASEDRLIRELYKKNGLGYVLEEISGLDPLSVLDNTI